MAFRKILMRRPLRFFLAVCLVITGGLFILASRGVIIAILPAIFAFALATMLLANWQEKVQGYIKGGKGIAAASVLAIFAAVCAYQASGLSSSAFRGEPWAIPLFIASSVVSISGFIAAALILEKV